MQRSSEGRVHEPQGQQLVREGGRGSDRRHREAGVRQGSPAAERGSVRRRRHQQPAGDRTRPLPLQIRLQADDRYRPETDQRQIKLNRRRFPRRRTRQFHASRASSRSAGLACISARCFNSLIACYRSD